MKLNKVKVRLGYNNKKYRNIFLILREIEFKIGAVWQNLPKNIC